MASEYAQLSATLPILLSRFIIFGGLAKDSQGEVPLQVVDDVLTSIE